MAEFGLQAWDELGRLTMDQTFRPGRVHGIIEKVAPVTAGSLSVPSLVQGTPFFLVISQGDTNYDRATVSLSGTTFTWGNSSYGFSIFYGTF